MKKFRQKLEKFVKGFQSGSQKEYCEAILLVHYGLLECLFLIITYIYFVITNILNRYNIQKYILISVVILLIPIMLSFSKKISKKILGYTGPIVTKIVFFFGRNGKVICRKDWKKIKKEDPALYNDFWQNNNYEGHCYCYSRKLALHIEGSKLLYLSIKKQDEYISHAVVYKDGCVFDTNARIHFELNEYLKLNHATIYSFFDNEKFQDDNFFEKIRPELISYCKEHGVYCAPE